MCNDQNACFVLNKLLAFDRSIIPGMFTVAIFTLTSAIGGKDLYCGSIDVDTAVKNPTPYCTIEGRFIYLTRSEYDNLICPIHYCRCWFDIFPHNDSPLHIFLHNFYLL